MIGVVVMALFAAPPFPVESYTDARWLAVERNRPLVVGVRCDPPAGEWVSCRVESWPWGKGAFVVVSAPEGKELIRRADLPAKASRADVAGVLSSMPARTGSVTTVTQTWTTRPPTSHTHTCPRCGRVWDHAVTSGHNCPSCGAAQWVQDRSPRPVHVLQSAASSVQQVPTKNLPRKNSGCPD